MWDFNQKTVKIGHEHNPPLKHNTCIMVHIFCFRVGALVWSRGCAPPFTQVVKTQMLSQLPRPLGCCWFVVCVLSRCLRLAFFAFCCSQPLFWGFVCKVACRLRLVTLVGEFALLLSPSACVYGGAWWVGACGLFVVLCMCGCWVMWSFCCFWGCFLCVFLLGLLLDSGRGRAQGVSFGFSRGCSNGVLLVVEVVFRVGVSGSLWRVLM